MVPEPNNIENVVVLGNWPKKGGLRALGWMEATQLDTRLGVDVHWINWYLDMTQEGGSKVEYHIGQQRTDLPKGYKGPMGVFNRTITAHIDVLAKMASAYGEQIGRTAITSLDDLDPDQ